MPLLRVPLSRRPKISPTLQGILSLLRLLPQVSRTKTVLGLSGVLAAAVLPVGVAVVAGLLIGSIRATLDAGLASPAGHRTLTLLAVAGVLVMAQQTLSPVLAMLGETLGREVDRELQQRVMAAVGRPEGTAHLTDPEVLDALRVVRGLGMTETDRPSQAVAALAAVLPAWLRAVAAALALLAFHWWVGLLWLLTWPVVVHFMQREYFRVGEVGQGRGGALRHAEYLRDLVLTRGAAKEVRLWGLLDWLLGRFDGAWREATEPVWRERRPRVRVVLGATGSVALVNLVSYAALAWAAVHHDIGLGWVAVYTQALALANNYTAFDDNNAYLSFAGAAVPRVLGLDAHLEGSVTARPAGPPAELPAELPAAFPAGRITLEQVRFRYPGTEREALRGVDLTIEAGRSLAIVGENGAGKSSLVKLVCGLHVPTAGTIRVDGHDLAGLDQAAWRERIGVLFQDFARYHLSAAENIAMGAPRYAGDRERLREAAHRAGALPLIEGLADGWDTVLSPEYTGGTDLSGGQWQRIALARALFAVDAGARVLILDEPTAALDVRAEAEIYDRFLELTAGLTTILISHRFSTVRRAERIVVLEDGAVVEDGGHEELLARRGRYAEMFDLQAARFVEPRQGSAAGAGLRAAAEAGHA
ncbi:ABC transporter ATP-binding protein [Kitasatospora paracochleata]|uniref:ABC-type multidrug transport system fused ATPase/permease subunit n=1 Tax=Kitasatospora paracochleata TaxID=58354 RepID=A0ABT1JA96_9ACTN|nr:ATP-binding cassette domain-containing protein [Kitasatospora paracochleata]MCP2314376.1 ABC-type multidrug transport system fused ATPase/permease subunit [Kitasatospora paracochleata]